MTDKQKRFCEEYMIDLNATQAAIRAGYSVKTANEQGARLLANVSVHQEIERLKAERSRRTGITADRVLQELARIGFVNPLDVIDPSDAAVLRSANADDVAAIASVKFKVILSLCLALPEYHFIYYRILRRQTICTLKSMKH